MSSARTTKSTKTKKNVARNDEAKAELRERILIAARKLILEEGYASLSVRKLAERIGYAPGTIYLYFENRDALVREICVQGFGALSEAIKSKADAPDARARLGAILHAYADFAFSNPETYRLSFMENPEFAEEMLRSAPLEAETGAGRQAFALIVETLRELKQTGKLAAEEDELLFAEMLWTATHGIVSLKLIYPAFPINSAEKLIEKLLETALKKDEPQNGG